MTYATPRDIVMHDRLPDDELVRRARAGSHDAFDALVRRYDGRLYNVLRRRFHDADAQDIAQQAFIRAWQSLDQYDNRWRFSTWLFTIAWRVASNEQRARARQRTHAVQHAHIRSQQHVGRADSDPAARCAARETRDGLWSLADRVLDDASRTALWLRYVEDLPPREIGRVLGRSGLAVRVLLHRARRTIASHLNDAELPASPPSPAGGSAASGSHPAGTTRADVQLSASRTSP